MGKQEMETGMRKWEWDNMIGKMGMGKQEW